MKARSNFLLLCSSAFFVVLTSTHAQTIWDGNGNANASGNWNNDPTFWSTDLAPLSTENVELNDVTSGSRIVTLDAAGTGKTLSLTQSTAAAVNQLDISSTLTLGTINTTETLLATTNSSGSAGGIVVNLNSGGSISVTATGAKTFQNAGTLNFNGGSVLLAIGNNIQATRTLTNTGIVNVTASSSFTYTNSQTANNQSTGLFTNASGAQLNVNAGTFTFGNANTGTNLRSGTVRISNSGAATVAPAAVLLIKNNGGNQGSDTMINQLNNLADSTFTLGSASNSAGKGTLFFRATGAATSPLQASLDNAGTINIYGQSVIDNAYPGSLGTAFTVNNNTGGVMNLTPDSTGVYIGSDPASANVLGRTTASDYRHSIAVNNTGTINTASFDPLSTGLVRIGQLTSGGRNNVTFNNNVGGSVNVGVDTTIRLVNLVVSNGGDRTNTFNNASGATVNLGSSSDSTKGGVIQQTTAGTVTGITAASAPRFLNTGIVNAYGTSRIELSATSFNTTVLNTYTFTNNAGANLNLHDTTRLGNTTKITALNNAGTLTKLNAGTASVASAAGGTNTNTGNITVNAGALSFDGALDASASTSVIRLVLGADPGSARITTAGTLTYGGNLELIVNTASPAGVYPLFTAATPAGSFASITLSGSGGFSGTSAGSSIASAGKTFSFNAATGELTVIEGGLTPLEQWRQTYFGSSANSGNGADGFDFDFDGITNLVEYATGTNPTTSSSSPTTAGQSGGFLTVTFNRIADPSLTYTVKAGNDLSAFPTTIFTSTGVANTAGPVVATDTQPIAGNPKRFARLDVNY